MKNLARFPISVLLGGALTLASGVAMADDYGYWPKSEYGIELSVEDTYGVHAVKLPAANGKYATLEELASADLLPGGTEQRGYRYTATISATGFTITATPTAADKTGWPTLEITEAMQVTEK